MVEPELGTLAILARLEEAEAVADLSVEKITNALVDVVGSEAPSAQALGGSPCFDIKVPIGAPEGAANRVLQALCFALEGLVGDASDAAGDLLARASENLNGVIGAIEGIADNVSTKIADALNDVVASVTAVLERSLRNIIGAVENVVSEIGDFTEELFEGLERSIDTILNSVGFAIGGLINQVSDTFDDLLDAATSILSKIDSTVRSMGEFFVELAQATLEEMSLIVAATLGPLIGAGQSVLARLGDLVESVPGALRDAATSVAEGVGSFVGEPLNALGSILVTQIEEFFANIIEDGNLSHGEIIRTLFTRLGAPADVVDEIAAAADAATPLTTSFTAMALSFLIPLILAQFIGSALEPLSIQLQQRVAGSTQQSLIPAADLIDGFWKGDITQGRLEGDLLEAGFSSERTALLVSAARLAPDPSVAIQAWLRDFISEDQLDERLRANRMRIEDVELLKRVVFFVPPAQDLIRMAVREVFSPEIRQRFGQDEDFPEEFATFARQQGISDEWARAYWAAHWALPSPAQGFEMLHRGVIDTEDLDVLLRALDVMPFWRDKLTQIAFSPLTRVDLRRMHALGLLTDKELQTRYEAIGFSPDNAELMVAFTVVFNSSEDELPEELTGLTRASVLNMFEDGIIPRDNAVALIQQMGIGDDAAELFVEQRDLTVSRRERKDLIESIIRLAGGGRINLSQAEDSLAQLGISALEITKAVGRITGLIGDRDRLPSLAALEKMHNKEIIDDETFLDTIKALGFNDDWADREFELITGQVPPLPSELEGLTRASILSLFEDGLFSRDETIKALLGIGIGAGAAELLVAQKEGDIQSKNA